MPRIIETPKKPYKGPCAFEQGQGPEGASFDLCRAMSTSPHFKNRCEGCASPHHIKANPFVPANPVPKKREEWKDYVPRGMGLVRLQNSAPQVRSTVARAIAPAQAPQIQRVAERRETQNPEPETQPRPHRRNYSGAHLLIYFDKLKRERGLSHNKSFISKKIGMPYEIVCRLFTIPDISQEMRPLIPIFNVSPATLVDLHGLPREVHRPLLEAIQEELVTKAMLRRVLYRNDSKETLKARLAQVGFTAWPDTLNDDGTPKSA